ncbi:hypothetical protein ACJJTC_005217 [Scirpophaga incertulas]
MACMVNRCRAGETREAALPSGELSPSSLVDQHQDQEQDQDSFAGLRQRLLLHRHHTLDRATKYRTQMLRQMWIFSPDLASTIHPTVDAALQALNAQMAAVTLQPTPTGDNGQPTESRATESLSKYLKEFILTVQCLKQIRTEVEVSILRDCISNLMGYLPGPMTMQKLHGYDEKVFEDRSIGEYGQLLSGLLRLLIPHWPILKEELVQLFLVEEGFPVSHQILSVLCGFLKNETSRTHLKTVALLISKYVKSDLILVALLDCCCLAVEDNVKKYQNQLDWENYCQILLTLPERVANRLETDTPKEFSRENFAYKIVFHLVRCIDFISENGFRCGARHDISYLTHFMSKFIVNFNMSGTTIIAILEFIDILICWTSYNDSPHRYVKKKLVQTLLCHLTRQAIDCLAYTLLNRCPIDYKKDEQCIRVLLGDNIDESKNWHDILTHKAPFYFQPNDHKKTTIPENLIYYISTSKKAAFILSELVIALANAWADIKAGHAGHVAQHMYVSQLLVLGVRYRALLALRGRPPTAWDTQPVKDILFRGMSRHLNVVAYELRCIGMITIDGMPERCLELIKVIQSLLKKCLLDDDRDKTGTSRLENQDVNEFLDSLAMRILAEDEWPPAANTIVTCAIKSPAQTREIVKTIIADKLDALQRGNRGEAEELDSDDELVPYDMSNDVPVAAKKRPNYLRDLHETLVEVKDIDTFEVCLEVAEELIVKQMKDENRKFTEDLLCLFVNLDEKFHVDDFETKKFNICVEIVCCQPRYGAEYLCKEIHADVGRYSIGTKIFMLEVVAAAATNIADLKSHELQAEEASRLPEATETKAEEIIRLRLLKKTRYYHSKQVHPFAKAKKNRFAAVSDSFFFPLMAGFGLNQLTLNHRVMKQDVDKILMMKYLSTVGSVILASQNCPKCRNYCWEVLQILNFMKNMNDPQMRLGVLSLLGAIVVAMPEQIMYSDFSGLLLEFRPWLEEVAEDLEENLGLLSQNPDADVLVRQVLAVLDREAMGYGLSSSRRMKTARS